MTADPSSPTHLDVLIVGAGLSGIGAAHRLGTDAPEQRWAILEARDDLGGTWDTFRYPGVRCDSDVATLAYPFRPWAGRQAIASGTEILDYLRRTAEDARITERIRFGHRVVAAAWSSEEARWTVTARTDAGDVELTTTFLFFCSGYFSHDAGHVPRLAGLADYRGTVVHPQAWPADLEVAGRRVVVLGSGATAVTLAPALAESGAHVTLLQRSPSWVTAGPRRRRGPRRLAARRAALGVWWCRRFPRLAGRWLTRGVQRRLPTGYPVDVHFAPRYAPWDQRLCVAADGDLFAAISAGTVEVVTDRVETLDATGVRLASGDRIEADVLVTATGLRLVTFGGAALTVDGRPVVPHELVVRHGSMFTGLPNLAWCLGGSREAWTRRADRSARLVVEVVERLRRDCLTAAIPAVVAVPEDAPPMLDLTSGYVRRVAAFMPRADPDPSSGLDGLIWTDRTPRRDTLRR